MKKILVLGGSANISGGTYVILQHAYYLQTIGFDVTLACINFKEAILLQAMPHPWHPALKKLHFISIDAVNKQNYDLAIFTWWKTIYYLPQVSAKFYIYFVQSIESKFYNPLETALHHLVNSTYTFNLPVITEATWIKKYLYQRYGTEAKLVHNGIRKDIYCIKQNQLTKNKKSKLRVLVEGPLAVPYKNVEKTIALCAKVPNIEIWWLTSSEVRRYKNVDKVFSCLPIDKTAEVYNACDVLVKLSYVEGMFSPPLEIFHCGGTCIVYDVTGHDEYIKNGYNGIVIKTDDEESVVNSLSLLANDRIYLNKLKMGALETAKHWISWEQSSNQFYESLKQLTSSPSQICPRCLVKEIELVMNQYNTAIKNQSIPDNLYYNFKNFLRFLLKKYPKLNILKNIYYLIRLKIREL